MIPKPSKTHLAGVVQYELVTSNSTQVNADDRPTVERPTLEKPLVRTFVGLFGIGFAAAGVAAVFKTGNGAGAAALLGLGSLFVLLAAIGDQLQSLRYGDLELVLLRKADEAAVRGDVEAARTFRQAADTVGQRVERTARSYKAVRGGMPSGPARTGMMEQILQEARHDAHIGDVNDDEVLSLLWTGSVGARVWALAVLQERPELATTRAVLEAVQRPDEMFDQYHALVLADRFVSLSTTRAWARERVAAAVSVQLESGAFGSDRPCIEKAKAIIEHAAPPA